MARRLTKLKAKTAIRAIKAAEKLAVATTISKSKRKMLRKNSRRLQRELRMGIK